MSVQQAEVRVRLNLVAAGDGAATVDKIVKSTQTQMTEAEKITKEAEKRLAAEMRILAVRKEMERIGRASGHFATEMHPQERVSQDANRVVERMSHQKAVEGELRRRGVIQDAKPKTIGQEADEYVHRNLRQEALKAELVKRGVMAGPQAPQTREERIQAQAHRVVESDRDKAMLREALIRMGHPVEESGLASRIADHVPYLGQARSILGGAGARMAYPVAAALAVGQTASNMNQAYSNAYMPQASQDEAFNRGIPGFGHVYGWGLDLQRNMRGDAIAGGRWQRILEEQAIRKQGGNEITGIQQTLGLEHQARQIRAEVFKEMKIPKMMDFDPTTVVGRRLNELQAMSLPHSERIQYAKAEVESRKRILEVTQKQEVEARRQYDESRRTADGYGSLLKTMDAKGKIRSEMGVGGRTLDWALRHSVGQFGLSEMHKNAEEGDTGGAAYIGVRTAEQLARKDQKDKSDLYTRSVDATKTAKDLLNESVSSQERAERGQQYQVNYDIASAREQRAEAQSGTIGSMSDAQFRKSKLLAQLGDRIPVGMQSESIRQARRALLPEAAKTEESRLAESRREELRRTHPDEEVYGKSVKDRHSDTIKAFNELKSQEKSDTEAALDRGAKTLADVITSLVAKVKAEIENDINLNAIRKQGENR